MVDSIHPVSAPCPAHAVSAGDAAGAGPAGEPPASPPVRLAVFDFDGTCIDGNSPVILVRRLAFARKLKVSVLLRIIAWALAYKFHLPQNESWVRGLVFTAFAGMPVSDVDEYLRDFYDKDVDCLWRDEAVEAMLRHKRQGDTVVVVSATFEPIAARAMESKPFDALVATRMRIADDGTYTSTVQGDPVEGAEKLAALRRFADERFGPDGWVLAYAYGDHYSDRVILDAAEHPHAVTPGSTLNRFAKKQGWPVLDW